MGRHRRAARRRGLARVGVRPAAHHRRRAALVVEPACRAGHGRSRAPARQPLRAHVDDDSKRDIWGPAAQELLTSLLLAAAASRRTLRDVSRWLDDPGTPTPAELLDGAGYRALGSALRGAQHGAPETRDGIYQTARTAAKCLHDEQIMAWVTPPRGQRLPAFDPSRFPVTRDTLYLLTESRSAASPLIAGLTDTTLRAGRRQRRAGRRAAGPAHGRDAG